VTGWWERAACKGAPQETFFPDARHGTNPYREARSFCARCEVWSQCLTAALAEEETTGRERGAGLRGGMAPLTRFRWAERIRRGQATPADALRAAEDALAQVC
jgi:hypothetical protein